jgi:O-antigen/teichoic acid export membrane protein
LKLKEHLSTGIWAAADKAILLLYGFAVIVVVINVLPEREYGSFMLFQSIFLIICVLSDSVFLQPMVKFASEHKAEVGLILAASFNLYVLVMMVSGAIFALLSSPLGAAYLSTELTTMMLWMPVVIGANILRGIGNRYLQITYSISKIFWVDLSYYGSMIILTILAHSLGMFHTGLDFLYVNLLGGLISSIVAFWFCKDAFLSMPLLSVPRNEYGKLISFAKFQAGTSALLTLQQWGDVLILGIYSPAETKLANVALFSAAKTLYRGFDAVREGATLLIVPVASKTYTAGDKEGLSSLIERMLFFSFALLIPVSLVMTLGSPVLMDIFYKNKFNGIDGVFRILMLGGFTLPLSLVATNVLIGTGHVKGLFFSTLAATIVFFGLNRLIIPSMQAEGAAVAVFASTTVLGILTFFVMRRELSVSARGVLKRGKKIQS